MPAPRPVILAILDGFGVSLEREGNPVAEARTPTLDEFDRSFPFALLAASEVAVGLPWGEAGNSEVGHLTIGAGRVIYHHLPRIIQAIHDRSFFQNEAFRAAAEHVKTYRSRLHIAGLVSSGSVHSYLDHLYALLDFTTEQGIPEVYLHVFSDGKDAPPTEGAEFFAALEERLKTEWPQVRLSSVIGRRWALDRDEKWDQIQKTYELLTDGKGTAVPSIPEYVRAQYSQGVTDEFIEPAILMDRSGARLGLIQTGDALIFSDFREDSMREITRAFVEEPFPHFSRKKIPNLLVVTLTEYQKGLTARAAFPPLDIPWPLARVLSNAGLHHLHIAETQKYAHVTYFLNGGREKPFSGEERILIPSLAVPHPDQVPEMKAEEITRRILENLTRYDVVIVNYANADMVGHTGNFRAAVRAVEVLDQALAELSNAVLNTNGLLVVTADHGNIELKRNRMTGEPLTEHSINPVPFYLVGRAFYRSQPRRPEEILRAKKEVSGILTDVSPTLIELLSLHKPREMTGESLLTAFKKTS